MGAISLMLQELDERRTQPTAATAAGLAPVGVHQCSHCTLAPPTAGRAGQVTVLMIAAAGAHY
jgi:hypothetical protein